MSTNYNQLLKDLEIGSVYVKIGSADFPGW